MAKKRGRLSMLLIIVLTLVLISSVFAHPKNAFASTELFLDVKNNSFENVSAQEFGKPIPTDWIINNQNFDADNVDIISTNAYDNINYLQLKNGSYSIESQDFIEIDSQHDYLFGVKFIFSNIDDSCKLSVKTYNAQNELINTHQSQTVVSNQDFLGKWQEIFFVLNKDSNVKNIKISIDVQAVGGSVGVDYVYAHKNFISLYDGASISLERNVLSIRFTAKLDAQVYQMLLDRYESVTVGLIVSPRAQVNRSSEFTIKGVLEKENLLVVPTTHWNNPQTYEQDGYYNYYCAFASQGYASLQKNLGIAFTTRAYLKYVENGVEKIIYSSWNMENNCRSIRQVATLAKQDQETYNGYSPDQQEIITAYIEGRVPSFEGLD